MMIMIGIEKMESRKVDGGLVGFGVDTAEFERLRRLGALG